MKSHLVAALAACSVPVLAQPAVTLPAGTPVRIVLPYGVSAKAARVDDIVYMRVAAAIKRGETTLIPEGAGVQGRVSRAVPPGGGGRPGEIVIDAEYVVTETARYRVTGSISTAGYNQTPSSNGGAGGAVGGSITVPLGGRKALNANLPAGAGFEARIARDY